ncbi:MAG: pantoate--beta-alanine ligase [Candidatus Hydrogenedentota bacterium]
MRIFKRIKDYRDWRDRIKGKIGFVPTMGALHQGHISLIREMKKECDISVVSIFVNPLQFGKGEDFNKYPRPLKDDLKICRIEKVDCVFLPDVKEMYPQEVKITIDPGWMGDVLCGIDRPGHFAGVLTVVLKLFMIIKPEIAYFGKKDYQQYVLIKRMTKDLNIAIKIVGCPTIREKTGLALSSRNKYLNENEKKDALLISKSLYYARERFSEGINKARQLQGFIKKIINTGANNKIIYIKCIDFESLQGKKVLRRGDVIAIAVRTGNTRLIDNIEL